MSSSSMSSPSSSPQRELSLRQLGSTTASGTRGRLSSPSAVTVRRLRHAKLNSRVSGHNGLRLERVYLGDDAGQLRTLIAERRRSVLFRRHFDRVQLGARRLWNENAPVSRLPGDILRIILVMMRQDFTHNGRPFVTVLSQVCRYWRDITINTGAVWSRIVAGRWGLPTAELTKVFLDRSKLCPLDVVFVDASEELGDVLLDHIRRTRTISIISSGNLSPLLRHCNVAAPLLESLCISCPHPEADHQSTTLFPFSPNLKTLVLYAPVSLGHFNISTSHVEIYRRHIKDLAFDLQSVCSDIQMALQMPSLQHIQLLSLSPLVDIFVKRRISGQEITLVTQDEPKIRMELLLRAIFSRPVVHFAVESFSLWDLEDALTNSEDDAQVNLRALRELTLTSGSLGPRDSDRSSSLLQDLPALTRLAATDSLFWPILSAFLEYPQPERGPVAAPLVLSLHTLGIGSCEEDHDGDVCAYADMVCDIVEARAKAGFPLTMLEASAKYLTERSVHLVPWLERQVRVEVATYEDDWI